MRYKSSILIFRSVVSDALKIKLSEKNKADLRTMFRKVICDYFCIALTGRKYVGNLGSLENFILFLITLTLQTLQTSKPSSGPWTCIQRKFTSSILQCALKAQAIAPTLVLVIEDKEQEQNLPKQRQRPERTTGTGDSFRKRDMIQSLFFSAMAKFLMMPAQDSITI